MRGIGGRIAIIVVVAGAAVTAYHVLLTPQARESLRNMASTIKRGYETINDAFGDAKGKEMQEEVLPNREATISQWEAIGY